MNLEGEGFSIRRMKHDDAVRLAELANNVNIAQNLSDIFPHPYNLKDAEKWISINQDPDKHNYAIIVDGLFAGGIGFDILDKDQKHTALLGYWLGEPCWGKGIATGTVKLFTRYIFDNFPIERIEARVYTWNPASAKVLKKAGFRPKEVQLIFGYDIFRHYLDAIGLNYPDLTPKVKEPTQPFDEVKVEELITENKEELDALPDTKPSTLPLEEVLMSRKESGLCVYQKEDGEFCENKAFQYSKGGMCFGHIKYDPTRKTKTDEVIEEKEINTKEEL